jgi:hypothetical protein
MNQSFIPTAALAWLLAAGSAQAAPAAPADAKDPSLKAPADKQLYEDVEIMRRLLDRAFERAYAFPSRKPGQPLAEFEATDSGDRRYFSRVHLGELSDLNGIHSRNLAAHEPPAAEGVYLKGVGVVYTATLPPPAGDPRAGKGPGGTPPPLSPWERTRRELRGDKVEDAPKDGDGQPPLADVILQVLADNGRHFTSLPDGEQITVAVTFRGAGCVSCHTGKNGRDPIARPFETDLGAPGGAAFRHLLGEKYDQGGKPADAKSIGSGAAPAESFREAQLLGDLHLKQGRAKEAAEAYLTMLKKLGMDADGKAEKWAPPVEVNDLLATVELLQGFAKAKLALKESDAAHNALKLAEGLEKRAQDLTGGAANPGPPAPPAGARLPSKLVVTASKKQLDQIGSGKMTFDEFRQAATVEYLTFPAPEPKAKSTGPQPEENPKGRN